MASSLLPTAARSLACRIAHPLGAGGSLYAAAAGALRSFLPQPLEQGRAAFSDFAQKKEEFKGREWPDKGTTVQEGSGETRAAAEEAGYERAREDGERVRKADTLGGTVKEAAHTAGDAAKGVGEMGQKIADMGREAAGRGMETAKGMAGMGQGQSQGQGGAGESVIGRYVKEMPFASDDGSHEGAKEREGRETGTSASSSAGVGGGGGGGAASSLNQPITPDKTGRENEAKAGSYSGP